MVIIRYMCKVLVIAQGKGITGQWLHLRFIVSKKYIHLGGGSVCPSQSIDVRYFFTDIFINVFDTVVNLFLQVFQQMSFKETNIFFNSWLSFGLCAGGGVITTS